MIFRQGLKENFSQFALLVLINGLVGGMVGIERSILPQYADERFEIDSNTAILAFIVGLRHILYLVPGAGFEPAHP
jgi:hypothetical protein